MSYIGNSIIGDTLYGHPSELISRQALHSSKVSFIHPITHKQMIIEAPLFDDMKKIINNL